MGFPGRRRTWVKTTILLLVGGGVTGTPDLKAQIQRAVIDDQPTCQTCTISLDLSVELGGANDGGMVMSQWVAPYALRGGRWLSLGALDPGAFRFYDPSGAFTHRFEAEGEGPGEYRAISDILRTSDGYRLYDLELGRLSSVSEEFDFLRSVPFPAQVLRMAALPGGGSGGQRSGNGVGAQGTSPSCGRYAGIL